MQSRFKVKLANFNLLLAKVCKIQQGPGKECTIKNYLYAISLIKKDIKVFFFLNKKGMYSVFIQETNQVRYLNFQNTLSTERFQSTFIVNNFPFE